jgi:hypothetical protein
MGLAHLDWEFFRTLCELGASLGLKKYFPKYIAKERRGAEVRHYIDPPPHRCPNSLCALIV